MTYIDGNEFIIDKLYKGAILNFRVVFTEDVMMTNVRACCFTTVAVLTEDKLQEVADMYPQFNKKVGFFKNSLFRENKIVPLDYIFPTNSKLMMKKLKVRNILKNVIFNIIDHKRKQQEAFKLGDFLRKFEGHDKDYIRNKLEYLFCDKKQHTAFEDQKFNTIMSGLRRLDYSYSI